MPSRSLDATPTEYCHPATMAHIRCWRRHGPSCAGCRTSAQSDGGSAGVDSRPGTRRLSPGPKNLCLEQTCTKPPSSTMRSIRVIFPHGHDNPDRLVRFDIQPLARLHTGLAGVRSLLRGCPQLAHRPPRSRRARPLGSACATGSHLAGLLAGTPSLESGRRGRGPAAPSVLRLNGGRLR